jgi:hypothetical protein
MLSLATMFLLQVADKTDRWHHLAILEGEELSQW